MVNKEGVSMDFQSAARFGTRRVMVTDYDETAVKVNAKVVDEDTGKVICECESGGGGGESDFAIANVIVQSGDAPDVFFPAVITTPTDTAAIGALVISESGNPYQAVLYKGHCMVDLGDTGGITVVSGNATISGSILDITGDCTISIS